MFPVNERLFEYLRTSNTWIPKSLIACPFVVLVLICQRQFDRPTTAVLLALSLAPLVVSALGFQLVSQRMIEMSYSAILVRFAMNGQPLPFIHTILLLIPAGSIFLYRALFGVVPAG
jgi:hypothetical protein